jgi:hypothetical protein
MSTKTNEVQPPRCEWCDSKGFYYSICGLQTPCVFCAPQQATGQPCDCNSCRLANGAHPFFDGHHDVCKKQPPTQEDSAESLFLYDKEGRLKPAAQPPAAPSQPCPQCGKTIAFEKTRGWYHIVASSCGGVARIHWPSQRAALTSERNQFQKLFEDAHERVAALTKELEELKRFKNEKQRLLEICGFTTKVCWGEVLQKVLTYQQAEADLASLTKERNELQLGFNRKQIIAEQYASGLASAQKEIERLRSALQKISEG